jgi:hypothetical protein
VRDRAAPNRPRLRHTVTDPHDHPQDESSKFQTYGRRTSGIFIQRYLSVRRMPDQRESDRLRPKLSHGRTNETRRKWAQLFKNITLSEDKSLTLGSHSFSGEFFR